MGVEDDFEYIKYKPNSEPAAKATYKKEVHPHGTIPALVIPGEPPILESGAICMYLADKYGKLVPPNKDRRDYYNFIMYGSVTLDELIDFFYQLWELKWGQTEEKVTKMRTKWDSCLDYLSRRLEGRTYLCGEELTAADCVVGYDLYLATVLGKGTLLSKHPTIQQYFKRLEARPAYKATQSME